MTLGTLIFALAIALVFAVARLICARLAASPFWTDFISMAAAVLVLLTHSLLGVAL